MGGDLNRAFVACQNCENHVFIDRIVPEKNQVEVAAHLGKLPFIDRKCGFRFTRQKLKCYASGTTENRYLIQSLALMRSAITTVSSDTEPPLYVHVVGLSTG